MKVSIKMKKCNLIQGTSLIPINQDVTLKIGLAVPELKWGGAVNIKYGNIKTGNIKFI